MLSAFRILFLNFFTRLRENWRRVSVLPECHELRVLPVQRVIKVAAESLVLRSKEGVLLGFLLHNGEDVLSYDYPARRLFGAVV